MRDLRQWENGGYFVLRPEIFDDLNEDEDLVEDAIVRLVPQGRVLAYPYKGYWSPADTVKERAQLEEMYHRGNCPWMIWDPERSGAGQPCRRARCPATAAGRDARWVIRRAPAAPEPPPGGPLSVLAIGAHPDDIEIGAGGRCSAWPRAAGLQVHYVVLTGTAERQQEARARPARSCPAPTSPSTCTTCPKAGCPRSGAR